LVAAPGVTAIVVSGRRPTAELAASAIGRANKNGGGISGYPGGKSGAGVYQRIINEMPPHDLYIEPFLGGGSVMFYKRRALRDVGVDKNGGTIIAARKLLPFAELVTGDGLEYLQRLLVDRHQQRRPGPQTSRDINLDGAGPVDPATKVGDSYSRIVVYADPPYQMHTRRGSKTRLYKAEATDQTFDGNDDSWHVRLLNILDALECNVMLSGYLSELYEARLTAPKWRAISYKAMTHAGPATEYLWCNFPQPMELHDYRYLGGNRRERERIRKKKKRWTAKLAGMPALERYAILAAIQDAQRLLDDGSE
jgi:DNA adenine methylase